MVRLPARRIDRILYRQGHRQECPVVRGEEVSSSQYTLMAGAIKSATLKAKQVSLLYERDGAVGQLGSLISSRSQVRILLPLMYSIRCWVIKLLSPALFSPYWALGNIWLERVVFLPFQLLLEKESLL